MIQLLSKDMRLGLDAILLWLGVAMSAVTLGAAVHWIAPGTFVLSVPGQVQLLGTLLSLAVAPTAALVTVAVLHGDRRHHAEAFAAAIPASTVSRMASKGVAILVISSIPLLSAALLTLDGSVPMRATPLRGLLVSMLAAIGFASAAAPATRRLFQGWAWSIALVAGAALAGLAGSLLSLGGAWLEAEWFATDHALTQGGFAFAVGTSTIASVKVGGFVALGYGAIAQLRPLSSGERRMTFLAAAVVVLLVGAEVARIVEPLANVGATIGATIGAGLRSGLEIDVDGLSGGGRP